MCISVSGSGGGGNVQQQPLPVRGDAERVERLPSGIVRHHPEQTGIGVALGLAGSLALTSALIRLLFNVTPTDLPSLVVASTILVAAALAAALLLGRRKDPGSVEAVTVSRAARIHRLLLRRLPERA